MKNTDTKSKVESLIDSMVAGKIASKDAVDSVLQSQPAAPETVQFAEGEAVVCPGCGSEDLIEGYVESDGKKLNALHCEACDTSLVESEDDSDEGEEFIEAEIDEDSPVCPICESDDLEGEITESEGEERLVIHCNGCDAVMVSAE